jgi:hypothetical protein
MSRKLFDDAPDVELWLNTPVADENMVFDDLSEIVNGGWHGTLTKQALSRVGTNTRRKVSRVLGMPLVMDTYTGQAAWLHRSSCYARKIPCVIAPATQGFISIGMVPDTHSELASKARELIAAVATMLVLHSPNNHGMDVLKQFTNGRVNRAWMYYTRQSSRQRSGMSPVVLGGFINKWMKDNDWPVCEPVKSVTFHINKQEQLL